MAGPSSRKVKMLTEELGVNVRAGTDAGAGRTVGSISHFQNIAVCMMITIVVIRYVLGAVNE